MCLPNAEVPFATSFAELNWAELQLEVEDLFTGAEFVYLTSAFSWDLTLFLQPKWPPKRLQNKVQLAKLGRSLFQFWKHERRKSGSSLHLTTAFMKKLLLPVERLFSISGFVLCSKRLSVTDENFKTKPLLIAVLIFLDICSRKRKADNQ